MTSNKETFEEYEQWADQEGGWVNLIRRNGASTFPEPIRREAQDIESSLIVFDKALDDWAEKVGAERL